MMRANRISNQVTDQTVRINTAISSLNHIDQTLTSSIVYNANAMQGLLSTIRRNVGPRSNIEPAQRIFMQNTIERLQNVTDKIHEIIQRYFITKYGNGIK